MDDLSKCNVYLCGACGLRVNANSLLSVQCGMQIFGRCSGVKKMIPRFSRNFACRKCEGYIGQTVE